MENYDVISVAGEGSYGIVMKCRNKVTKKVVAIKKLIDIEGDKYAKKMAFREIRILRVSISTVPKFIEKLQWVLFLYMTYEFRFFNKFPVFSSPLS